MLNTEDITNKILCGDAITILKQMPDECVDLCISSPPYYGLRKYGDYKEQIGLEETFAEFMEKILAITAEIKRVLKPIGQFWLNFGDCYASEGKSGGDFGKDGKMTKGLSGRARTDELQSKCLMMMPERIALKMIDEQGWILRNKIKWAKQVYLFKDKITKGSVMPTSVKDRFNESGEELYFFVKNKKYYSDLDSVRLPPQSELNFERPRMGQGNQTIYEQKRAPGIVRQKDYPESKYNKFNYRVRDAKRKEGQPQFKASEEEIKRYNEIPEDYGKKKLQNLPDKGKTLNRWMSGTPNFVKQNKVNDPRGNHEGGPGSWRDFKDENENFTNSLGKNLPTIWLIGSEPHNFQKELGVNTDHFAIFPQALVEIPIKFGCPKGGIVCDIFMGSGTTALVAKKLGRNYVGIELNEKYIEIAEKRINNYNPLL